MDSSDKYWLRFWGIVAIVIITIAVIGTVTVNDRAKQRMISIENMVAQGYSPIAADCALDPAQSHEVAKAFICAEEARRGRSASPTTNTSNQ